MNIYNILSQFLFYYTNKDMEQYYLEPEFYEILHSKSQFTDVISVKNDDIKLDEKPIIEYILSNIFRNVRIFDGDYVNKFALALEREHFIAETAFCLEYATELIKKYKIRLPKDRVVQFVDDNPFLGGHNNAYGKLIMEKCCAEISYKQQDDLIYDIYLAGETLRLLYINFPKNISSDVYASCKSYFDIINLPRTHQFSQLCSFRSCDIRAIDRPLFFQIYKDKQFDWIRDELKYPDIFTRIFKLNYDSIAVSALNDAKVETLKTYMIRLADRDKTNKELFHSQIRAELGSYPYSDMVLNFADQVYRLCQLGGLKINISDSSFPSPLTTLTTSHFSNQEPLKIYRFSAKNTPETKIFAFDNDRLGINIIHSFFTKFSGLDEQRTFDLLRNVMTYEQAAKAYESVSKFFIRNKIATSTMTSLNIWVNRNRNDLEKYTNKKIVYDFKMNFLGGDENFFGKAFERVIKNVNTIVNPSSPIYNPRSPIYNPQSPVYNPQSPVFNPQPSPSPKKVLKLSPQINKWLTETTQNIKSSVEELERISSDSDSDIFINVFFSPFISLLNINPKIRHQVAMGVVGVEKMILENNIADLIEMFPQSYVEEFNKLQKAGRKILSKPITHKFFWEIVSGVAMYLASFTYLPDDQVYHLATSMVLNVFDTKQEIEKYIKKFENGVFDERTTNRINFSF